MKDTGDEEDAVEEAKEISSSENNAQALPTDVFDEKSSVKATSPQSGLSSDEFNGFGSPDLPNKAPLIKAVNGDGINGDDKSGFSEFKAKHEMAWLKTDDNCDTNSVNESKVDQHEPLDRLRNRDLIQPRPSSPVAGPSGLCQKKAGRKRKRPSETENIEPLPPDALAGKPQVVVDELSKANEILYMLYGLKNVYFYFGEEPLPDRYGTFAYYSIVKEPMWLDKIRLKLLGGNYKGLDDFVADIRLIVENAYRFWGPPHRISKKALVVEEKLHKKLNALPEAMKKRLMCLTNRDSPIGSGRDFAEGSSPIMIRVQNEIEEERLKREQESELQASISDDPETKTLKSWESDFLLTEEVSLCIRHSSELVEIGQFLKLTQEILNIDDLTQYEVERMLAMPRESVSLQTIMTSIFSPDFRRSMLDQTPLMPYEVWNSKVSERLDRWFGKFYEKCDKVECMQVLGVEPFFWDVLGLQNVLKDQAFHEIQFYQRIWIMKSLLDNLMIVSKAVQDFFAVEERPEGTNILGKGANNSRYLAITSFFPEIRIYRELVPRKVYTKESEEIDDYFCSLERCRMLFEFDEEKNAGHFRPNDASFVLVAESLEDIEKLKNLAREIEVTQLLENLEAYTASFLNYIPCGNKGILALNKQWTSYNARPPEYFKNMMNLWFSTVKPANNTNTGLEAEIVTGKRKTSSQFSLAILSAATMTDSEEEADDNSDYSAYSSSDVDGEYVPSGCKKSKRKKKSPKPRDRSESQSIERSSLAPSPAVTPAPPKPETNQNKDVFTPQVLECWSVDEKSVSSKSSQPQSIVSRSSSVIISSSDDESEHQPATKSKSELTISPGVTITSRKLTPSVTCEKVAPSLPPDVIVSRIPSGVTISSSVQITKSVSLASVPSQPASASCVSKFPEVDIQPVRTTPPSASYVSREVTLQKVVVPNQSDDDDVVIVSGSIVMPKPLPEGPATPVKTKPKTPLPIPLSPQEWKAKFSKPRTSPRGHNSPISPRGASPRGPAGSSPSAVRGGFSPRGSPASRPQQAMTNGGWQGSPAQQRGGQVEPRRNLFTAGPVAELPTLTGALVYNPNGGWRVNLPDGGYIPLTNEEIATLKQNNNGRIPSRVTVPPR